MSGNCWEKSSFCNHESDHWEVENFQFRFPEKLSVVEGQFKKGVDDFRNTIYTMVLNEEGFVAELDYQHYFKPDIEDIRDTSPEKIFQEAESYVKNKGSPPSLRSASEFDTRG